MHIHTFTSLSLLFLVEKRVIDFSKLIPILNWKVAELMYKICTTPLDFIPFNLSLLEWVTTTNLISIAEESLYFGLLRKHFPDFNEQFGIGDNNIRIKILSALLLNVFNEVKTSFLRRLNSEVSSLLQDSFFETIPTHDLHTKLSQYLAGRLPEDKKTDQNSSLSRHITSSVMEKMELFNILTIDATQMLHSTSNSLDEIELWGCACDGIVDPIFSCAVWHEYKQNRFKSRGTHMTVSKVGA